MRWRRVTGKMSAFSAKEAKRKMCARDGGAPPKKEKEADAASVRRNSKARHQRWRNRIGANHVSGERVHRDYLSTATLRRTAPPSADRHRTTTTQQKGAGPVGARFATAEAEACLTFSLKQHSFLSSVRASCSTGLSTQGGNSDRSGTERGGKAR